LDDRRRDGGTNSTLRIKEQGKHLTLNEHDDDEEYQILCLTTEITSEDINQFVENVR